MLGLLKSAALCALTLSAFGQMNTAELGGTVQDQLTGRLAGAMIVAQQAATGQKFTTTSDETGGYLFASLPVGTYSLRVTAPNFKADQLPSFEAHAGDRLKFDFTLQVSGPNDTVTVEAWNQCSRCHPK